MSRRRVLRIEREEPAEPWWFERPDPIPRVLDRHAVYHYAVVRDENDPYGLIECSDGAVFTTEDAQ